MGRGSIIGALLLLVSTAVLAAEQPAFRIGVDDVLAISVWDNKDVDQIVSVRPDGKISLPLLGEVQAGGLTVAELIERLNQGYGRSIKDAQVTVMVKDIRSRPVFFVGGFGKPGAMQLTQELTLLQAVSLAGGLAQTADDERAFIIRGEQSIPVDFARLMKGDAKQNIMLQPGDTVVVPVAEAVYIQGEVKAPGAVKFVKDLTVVKAITQVGGFTSLAAPKRVTLLRGNTGKKENVRLNVEDMIRDPQSAADVALQPNDIIIVPQRLF